MNRILPYSFNGLTYVMALKNIRHYNLLAQGRLEYSLGEGVLPQFSHVFQTVLQAMEDNDPDFLQQIMEPKLFKATQQCLSVLQNQGLRLKYAHDTDSDVGVEVETEDEQQEINKGMAFTFLKSYTPKTGSESQDANNEKFPFIYEEKDLKINIDCKGVFGVRINREENQGRKIIKMPSFPHPIRKYYIDLANPAALFRDQILILNVIYKTTRRLLAEDQEGKVVYGEEDMQVWQYHRWRFESYTKDINWVLTDMDDYLKGNFYLK